MSNLRDLNFETGAKITGQVTTWEKLTNLLQPAAEQPEWFDKAKSANVIDISKWQGDINWPLLLSKTDGLIARLGYGGVEDKRFRDSVVPGFKQSSDYKGLYHYMNTGVRVESQTKLCLNALDMVDVDAFWVDIEGAYNETTAGAYFKNPLEIMNAVASERPDLSVGFYTNRSGWLALKKLGDVKSWLDKYLFWLAWYPYNVTRYPFSPDGLSLSDIYLWQYSAGGNGRGPEFGASSGSIDINVSRDPLQEFLMESQEEYTPTPEQTPEPIPVPTPEPTPEPDHTEYNNALDDIIEEAQRLRR